MQFDYDECREIFHRALLTALHEHRDAIRKLHATEAIWAISYYIIPWQPYISIAFRLSSESNYPASLVSADWKYFDFITDRKSQALVSARDFAHEAYESVSDDSKRCQDVAHLIYLAAADALLDPSIATLLQSLGINALEIGDALPRGYFKYIVIDEDKVIKANYCDIVCANRVTRRLLGRTV